MPKITYLYAIADAGGNIYPGSFRAKAENARVDYIIQSISKYNSQYTTFSLENIEEEWSRLESNGDILVYCKIESSLNTNVNITNIITK